MAKSVSFESENMMSKIKIFFSNSKMIMILIGVILIVVVVLMFMRKQSTTTEPFQNTSPSASGQAEIMLFSVDWCPHCKTAKPEWEQVKTEFDGKVVNGKKVQFTYVNCTNESPEIEKLMNTYQIKGYPTIKLIKEGQVIDFEAKPTKSTLTQFLNTAV